MFDRDDLIIVQSKAFFQLANNRTFGYLKLT